MSQNPIFDPRHAYEDGVRAGKRMLDEATERVLRKQGAEILETRKFLKRVSETRNLPRWITQRAAKLAQNAPAEERPNNGQRTPQEGPSQVAEATAQQS
jgi:hypothetical protein